MSVVGIKLARFGIPTLETAGHIVTSLITMIFNGF